jgi:hypothetical protein
VAGGSEERYLLLINVEDLKIKHTIETMESTKTNCLQVLDENHFITGADSGNIGEFKRRKGMPFYLIRKV